MVIAPLKEVWTAAAEIDHTVAATPTQRRKLVSRRVKPQPFDRQHLFRSMAARSPVLFSGLRLPTTGGKRDTRQIDKLIETGLPKTIRIRTRCGPSATRGYLSPQELIARWRSPRARVSVTDLHIRDTRFFNWLDCEPISDFNLLARSAEDINYQEMLTLVVSSTGTFSDSHSDDPDGSNHCFVGRKLWLVWDTFEGLAHGLEDVERCEVNDQARFSMAAFLRLRSGRWFTVEPGQTLFLPGHLTHKVITLERYIGVGSFFVTIANYAWTLARWTRHTPLWALNLPATRRLALVDSITALVVKRAKSLERASFTERARWGFDVFASSNRAHLTAEVRQLLASNPRSAQFIEYCDTLAGKPSRAGSPSQH